MTTVEAKYFSEISKAYGEGKTIQKYVTVGPTSQWVDITELSLCDVHSVFSYRIKPELKHRPYENAAEFLKAQKEHGPYLCWDNCTPYYIPLKLDNAGVWLFTNGQNEHHSYKELAGANGPVWQDKTPCTIIEETKM